MEDSEGLMGATKAAEYLGVSVTRLNEIRITRKAAGQDFGQKIADRWVYSRAELDAYKEERKHNKGGRPKSADLIPTPVIRVGV